MSAWNIRCATSADIDAVLQLWTVAEASPTVTDHGEALEQLLEHDPQALLLATSGTELVGSLIAAWNGWRGTFYRLAVHPDHRRGGLASELVREAERRLSERGAVRVDAIVATDEVAAASFWTAIGYERQAQRARFVRNLITGYSSK